MGSKYMLQVLPGEQNVSIFLFFIKEYIGMDMYKTESVTLKLPHLIHNLIKFMFYVLKNLTV
ncbi:hypothetical protein BANRA_02813 [Acinetobacter baumannii]|nr:hypothetical protein BANRA_02813 [Acinetobacter baumannii]